MADEAMIERVRALETRLRANASDIAWLRLSRSSGVSLRRSATLQKGAAA